MNEMPKSIIANIPSDDGYTFVYVSIPLTEKLIVAINKGVTFLIANDEFYEIVLSGSAVNKLSFPSIQYERNFRDNPLSEGECRIVKYSLKAIEKVDIDIIVSTRSIRLEVVYQDIFFGGNTPVFLALEEVFKNAPTTPNISKE